MSQPSICGDKEALVAYLYDEADPIERERVAAHLAACEACRAEYEGLRSVRVTLADWAPPTRALAFRLVQADQAEETPRAVRWWRRPAWAQAAAAVLVLAAGAAIANLNVSLGNGGVSFRTGWQHPAAVQPMPVAANTAGGAEPWSADLAALEQRLLTEVAARPASVRTSGAPAATARPVALTEAQVRTLVQALISDSEARQRRELALRVAEVQRDVEGQRRADLVRIQDGLGQLGGWTGAEISRQRQTLDYLLRVNSQQIK